MAAKASKGLEDVHKLLELAARADESIDALKGVFRVLKGGSVLFAVGGIFLDLFSLLLPDTKHEEIMKQFKSLQEALTDTRRDIKDLKDTVVWESTKLQYAAASEIIISGMDYCSWIQHYTKEKDDDNKELYETRLKELCSGEQGSQAVSAILHGIVGGSTFRNDILDGYYKKTGGDRKQMAKAAGRLIQLVTGGISMVLTYISLTENLEKAQTFEENTYQKDYANIGDTVNNYLDKCRAEFNTNMTADVARIVSDHSEESNRIIVTTMFEKLSVKYDWLTFDCVVYDDICGFNRHTFSGNSVEQLHFKNKCAIAFFTDEKRSDDHDDLAIAATTAICSAVQQGIMAVICKDISSYSQESQNKHLVYDLMKEKATQSGIELVNLGCWDKHIGLEYASSTFHSIWEMGEWTTIYCLYRKQ